MRKINSVSVQQQRTIRKQNEENNFTSSQRK